MPRVASISSLVIVLLTVFVADRRVSVSAFVATHGQPSAGTRVAGRSTSPFSLWSFRNDWNGADRRSGQASSAVHSGFTMTRPRAPPMAGPTTTSIHSSNNNYNSVIDNANAAAAAAALTQAIAEDVSNILIMKNMDLLEQNQKLQNELASKNADSKDAPKSESSPDARETTANYNKPNHVMKRLDNDLKRNDARMDPSRRSEEVDPSRRSEDMDPSRRSEEMDPSRRGEEMDAYESSHGPYQHRQPMDPHQRRPERMDPFQCHVRNMDMSDKKANRQGLKGEKAPFYAAPPFYGSGFGGNTYYAGGSSSQRWGGKRLSYGGYGGSEESGDKKGSSYGGSYGGTGGSLYGGGYDRLRGTSYGGNNGNGGYGSPYYSPAPEYGEVTVLPGQEGDFDEFHRAGLGFENGGSVSGSYEGGYSGSTNNGDNFYDSDDSDFEPPLSDQREEYSDDDMVEW